MSDWQAIAEDRFVRLGVLDDEIIRLTAELAAARAEIATLKARAESAEGVVASMKYAPCPGDFQNCLDSLRAGFTHPEKIALALGYLYAKIEAAQSAARGERA